MKLNRLYLLPLGGPLINTQQISADIDFWAAIHSRISQCQNVASVSVTK